MFDLGTNMTDNPKTEGQSSGTPSSDNAGEGKQEQPTNTPGIYKSTIIKLVQVHDNLGSFA